MKKTKRYWELDALRAMALGLMLVQHCVVVWNLVFYKIADAGDTVEKIGRIGAVIFLLLVGVSGFISYNSKLRKKSFSEISSSFFKRGVFLLGFGLLISVATVFVLPNNPVLFGVLSFIGLSVVLLPYFVEYKFVSWFFIFTAPLIGYLAQSYHPETMNLLVFGIYPRTFATIDYWPIFPWISLVLVGVEIGRRLYSKGLSPVSLDQPKGIITQVVLWIGSHTLVLYLIHIPILYLLFLCIKYLIS